MSEVLTGSHFVHGDWACAEGAIAAGCRFFGAYPITPATEISERMAQRLPKVGGRFVQFEDELAAVTAVISASYTGRKAMTATSGPGFSLMMESVGLGVMTEAPCVIVDVMRSGPSTGQPTAGAQGDVMQCRWGTHGDVEAIALAPQNVQEMFDLTVRSFNLSERYRTPVFVMADANIAHLYEGLVIPEREKLEIVERKRPSCARESYKPFAADEDLVPPMACFGEGYHFYATGLTHDDMGYPDGSVEAQRKLIQRLCDKIRQGTSSIVQIEEHYTEDCDVLVVAYGIVARSALSAVKRARAEGIKAGLLRLITLWPFPEERVEALAQGCREVVVAEMNTGQLVREVERASMRKVTFLPKLGEDPHEPGEILSAIRRASR